MNTLFYLLLINLLTLLLYKWDKANARRDGRRVPEFVLLLSGFGGGTLAAILAQQLFHHKTKKLSFQFKFWSITMLQLFILALQPPELVQALSAVQS